MSQFPEEPLNMPASEGFGYFPAYPGLKLKGDRYEIIRKLGYGPRSSVWLVEDLQGDHGFLALKILTAHATLQKAKELKRLQAVKQARYRRLPNLIDHFTENSHHGRHLCFGLAVMGASIEELRLSSPTKTLPVHVVQKVIASTLEALQNLHRSHIIHGAVIPDNIRIFVGQTKTDLDPVIATLPPCTIERKVTIDSVEYPIIRSQPIPHKYKWNDTHMEVSSFFLNNLGHAQTLETNLAWEKAGMDESLRPPEVVLGTDYNMKVDIWMLGCCTYELLTGNPLVPADISEDDSKLIGWLMSMSGDRIKQETVLEAELEEEFFDENGIFTGVIPKETLESRLVASGNIPAKDIPEIVKFIKTCLLLNFSERPPAGNLIENEWLVPSFACSCGYSGR